MILIFSGILKISPLVFVPHVGNVERFGTHGAEELLHLFMHLGLVLNQKILERKPTVTLVTPERKRNI